VNKTYTPNELRDLKYTDKIKELTEKLEAAIAVLKALKEMVSLATGVEANEIDVIVEQLKP